MKLDFGGRTARLVLMGAAVLLILAAVLIWPQGTSPSEPSAKPSTGSTLPADSTGQPSRATSDPTAPSAPTPETQSAAASSSTLPLTAEVAVPAAEQSLRAYLELADEAYQRADGTATSIGRFASGFAEGEVIASAAQRAEEGLRQVGSVRILRMAPTAVELSSVPPTVTLTACIDTSDIDVVDTAGQSLRQRLQRKAVEHVYGIVFDGSAWKVSTHEIPSAAQCKGE